MDRPHTKITRPTTHLVCRALRRPVPEGRLGVFLLGHRSHIGGKWEEVGQLQFDFLVSQGLRPEHTFLDIACGSLRGGVHFIRYLEPGHYLGIDKERSLIDHGLARELGADLTATKRPEFVVSDSFEFNRFSTVPDYSLAQSLFSHLVATDAQLCLRNLGAFVRPGHVAYVTFNEGDSARNPERSHPHGTHLFSRDEMASFAEPYGWRAEYVGDWNHPRGQKMMRYTRV